MSFYNPNIQSAFEADVSEFIVLRDVDLATYSFIFRISEGCSVLDVADLRAAYQLNFLRMENEIQQQNLVLVKDNFVALLAEIALEVLNIKVSSFEDFLLQKIEFTPEIERNEVLYLGDFIQDFIELLLYSDIAGIEPCKGERDFTKLLGVSSSNSGVPVFYSLYDRLKLYARLRKEIKLEIDQDSVKMIGREVYFKLKLKV